MSSCEHGDCVLAQTPRLIDDMPIEKSDIVIVSVAPGSMEFWHNEPIAGKPKQLLATAFEVASSSLDGVYITNVLRCSAAQPAQPSTMQLKNCHDRLMEDVARREPKKMLLLGRVATQAFFGSQASVQAYRGMPHTIEIAGRDVEVWVTQHPTAVMRSPASFLDLIIDVDLMVNGRPSWKVPLITECKSYDHLVRFTTGWDRFAFDFETTGFSPHQDEILCLGLGVGNSAIVIPDTLLTEKKIQQHLHFMFYSGAYKPVGHNTKFDMQWVFKLLGTDMPFVADDTMLMHYCLDERRGGHGLKLLATLYLGAPDYETEAKQYVGRGDNFSVIPRERLYTYCGTDCVATYRLHELFSVQLVDEGVRDPYDSLLIPGMLGLAISEYTGIAIDRAYLDELDEEYSAECQRLEDLLFAEFELVNPRSPKQVAEIMYDRFKLPLWHRERKVPKECLREYAVQYSDHKDIVRFCELMLEYRKAAKILSTYVKGIKERIINGRIHASWLLHGTVSGRASSQNPNLHNIPRGSPVKNAFVAGPGRVFVHCDYNQVEFRVMAVLSGDPWLQEQFRQGRRFHDEVATELYGPNFTKDQKIRAKAINFGIPYGRGAASIADEHHMSIKEAQGLLNAWFARMPLMRTWIDSVHHQVFRNGGILTTPFGRKRRFLLVTDFNRKDISHEAVAFLPQSTASDCTLWALGSLWKPLREYDAVIVNWIHDALLIECPKENVEQVIILVKSVMTSLPESKFNFPFPVDAEVGDRWGNLVSEDE